MEKHFSQMELEKRLKIYWNSENSDTAPHPPPPLHAPHTSYLGKIAQKTRVVFGSYKLSLRFTVPSGVLISYQLGMCCRAIYQTHTTFWRHRGPLGMQVVRKC